MSQFNKDMLVRLDEKLDDMRECQVRMENDLKYHIKRTDILETQVKPIGRAYDAAKLLVPVISALIYFKDTILKFLGD